MANKPRYKFARFLMEAMTALGGLSIILGIVVASAGYSDVLGAALMYPIAAGLVVNGIFFIAASEMGSATLDTAVASRETADAMAILISQRYDTTTQAPPSPRIRATR